MRDVAFAANLRYLAEAFTNKIILHTCRADVFQYTLHRRMIFIRNCCTDTPISEENMIYFLCFCFLCLLNYNTHWYMLVLRRTLRYSDRRIATFLLEIIPSVRLMRIKRNIFRSYHCSSPINRLTSVFLPESFINMPGFWYFKSQIDPDRQQRL